MKALILFFCFFSLSSCGIISAFKIRNAYQAEVMGKNTFKQVLPFREINGLIVIEVEISGRKENFIFDTGATTSIDINLAKKLKFSSLGKLKTFDSNKTKRHIKYVKLDKIGIGEVSFLSIVASVNDFEIIKKAACVNVSGILGVNVMNKGVWQIDYHEKRIVFSNSKDSFDLSEDKKTIGFYAVGKGVPKIRISTNEKYLDETALDTGNSGGFDFPKNRLPDSIRFVEKIKTSTGLFSSSIDSSKIAVLPNVVLGNNFRLDNTICTFNNRLPFALIGNSFLKNYIVTIDWRYQDITFSSYKPNNEKPYFGFGFSPIYKEGKIIIGSIYPNSQVYNSGIRLNDQLVQIDDFNLDNASHETYCKLIETDFPQQLTIKVKRDNQIFSINATKTNLLQSISTSN